MPINIKRSFHWFLVSTFLGICFTWVVYAGVEEIPSSGIRKVVIDAGHGGRDPGAEGKAGKEKDIALAIALKLGNYIEENMKDVEVIYTRKNDTFVELWERAEIANKSGADLFLSIHVNAHDRTTASGTLTLVLGQHRADENFDVAVRENSVILLEEDYETRYEGFDPKSTESYIMFSLMQKTYFKQSIEFGDFVQDQFRDRAGRKDLGVREQGIYVLAQTAMPGVLVETGFISNPEEEKFLMTEYGRDIIASAIFRGFRQYKEEIDRRSNLTVAAIRNDTLPETTPGTADTPQFMDNEVVFAIQIASSKTKTSTGASEFKGYSDVTILEDGRWYKYLVGQKTSYQDVLNHCRNVKKDFPDAFIIALKNKKIIPLNEAIEEINR
ncbi:MAG: N-acetylmuramoyl-L-alanine amidase [Bacteroidales bacterium]